VTSHGFALNINNNLKEFSYIVPCGITNKSVTSISQEVGAEIDIVNVKRKCASLFEDAFQKNKKENICFL
jgi:lipoyl(octanoyl) transferase